MATLLEEQNDRLQELSEIKDGWLDGEGQSLTRTSLSIAREILKEMDKEVSGTDNNTADVYLFPTVESCITFEIEEKSQDIYSTIEIDRNGTITIWDFDFTKKNAEEQAKGRYDCTIKEAAHAYLQGILR